MTSKFKFKFKPRREEERKQKNKNKKNKRATRAYCFISGPRCIFPPRGPIPTAARAGSTSCLAGPTGQPLSLTALTSTWAPRCQCSTPHARARMSLGCGPMSSALSSPTERRESTAAETGRAPDWRGLAGAVAGQLSPKRAA